MAALSGHEPKERLDTKTDLWLRSDLQLVSFKPVHYSDWTTHVLKTDDVKADNDDINTYRLHVGYTVICCFFRRLILYTHFETWNKYDFW
jgi:hypothetical protein